MDENFNKQLLISLTKLKRILKELDKVRIKEELLVAMLVLKGLIVITTDKKADKRFIEELESKKGVYFHAGEEVNELDGTINNIDNSPEIRFMRFKTNLAKLIKRKGEGLKEQDEALSNEVGDILISMQNLCSCGEEEYVLEELMKSFVRDVNQWAYESANSLRLNTSEYYDTSLLQFVYNKVNEMSVTNHISLNQTQEKYLKKLSNDPIFSSFASTYFARRPEP